VSLFGRSDDGGRAWWSVSCKSDPRFNMRGEAGSVWTAADLADEAIRRKIEELGLGPDEVPADIEYGGGKP
jgi:hypothetical protein